MRCDKRKIKLPPAEAAALQERHSAAMRVVRTSDLSDSERWDLLLMVVAPTREVREAQVALAAARLSVPDEVFDDACPYIVGDDGAARAASSAARELVTLER